jgi:hypothetical protein
LAPWQQKYKFKKEEYNGVAMEDFIVSILRDDGINPFILYHLETEPSRPKMVRLLLTTSQGLRAGI